jgi:hypothetical protein
MPGALLAAAVGDVRKPFMLHCRINRCGIPSTTLRNMIPTILALVPLVFATGCLVWTMTSGAQAQARSDAWAAQWMRDNA